VDIGGGDGGGNGGGKGGTVALALLGSRRGPNKIHFNLQLEVQ
jgi:hypothetical protein